MVIVKLGVNFRKPVLPAVILKFIFQTPKAKARFEREGEGDQPEGTNWANNNPGRHEPLSIFAVDLLLL